MTPVFTDTSQGRYLGTADSAAEALTLVYAWCDEMRIERPLEIKLQRVLPMLAEDRARWGVGELAWVPVALERR